MIKNILWDFDGVILDSMKVKGDGFMELFKDYDSNSLTLLSEYHYLNGGISRFDKIKYFYEKILKKTIIQEDINLLANKFASIIEEGLYDRNALIQESVNFIKKNYKNCNFHIVSGAEHKELNNLCKFFSLSKYFLTINGSPIHKNNLVKNILEREEYNNDETILIGDSINDYEAARNNNICFYGYNNKTLKDKSYIYIETFKNLKLTLG